MIVFILLCITLCPFQFCNHLDEEDKTSCFAIFVLQMSCYSRCSVALPHGVVGWSAVCECSISWSSSLSDKDQTHNPQNPVVVLATYCYRVQYMVRHFNDDLFVSCLNFITQGVNFLYLMNWLTYDREFSHFICVFILLLYVPVNSEGHLGMVSSSNHTLILGKLKQAVNQFFVYIISFVTYSNPSWMIQRKGGEWP